MSARSSRFSGFGSIRRRGKAAGAVIACAVMLLAGCGGSGGSSADAGAPVVRGDTLGRDWESTFPTVKASAGQVVVSWDKQITEDATESVVGYEVQISSSTYGPWTGAATGCAKSATKSSTRQTCTATGLADGTYFFNVAAVRKPVIKKDKTGNFSQGTRTGNFSAGSPPAIVLSPPGIPATPTVVVGNATFIVTVAAGTATDGTLGGVPASSTVTPTPATTPPMTCTVTGASGNCSITGVKAGAAYTFTATATNDAAVPPSGASAKSSTAQWGHMVAFDSNGGGGGGKASQFATSASALRMNTFGNPSGRHFSGWATTSTGPVEYVNGAPYAFTADAYLYAVWSCNADEALWVFMDAKRTSEHNADLSFRVTALSGYWTSFTGSTEGGDHATTVLPGGSQLDVSNGPMIITGLNRDSQYNFTVTATNNIGCTYTSPSDHTGNWGGDWD